MRPNIEPWGIPDKSIWKAHSVSLIFTNFFYILGMDTQKLLHPLINHVHEVLHYYFLFIIIIFILSWYKIVTNTNKNQPSSRYNYISMLLYAQTDCKIWYISSALRTTICIYWIPIKTEQLKITINKWEMYIITKLKIFKS